MRFLCSRALVCVCGIEHWCKLSSILFGISKMACVDHWIGRKSNQTFRRCTPKWTWVSIWNMENQTAQYTNSICFEHACVVFLLLFSNRCTISLSRTHRHTIIWLNPCSSENLFWLLYSNINCSGGIIHHIVDAVNIEWFYYIWSNGY